MKVYQALSFHASSEVLEQFIREITDRLNDGWSRKLSSESEVPRAIGRLYCFSCVESGKRPACELWLAKRQGGTQLDVSNILSASRPALSYDEYNAVLQEFHERFARPAATATGVRVVAGAQEEFIESYLSPAAVMLLRQFSSVTNRNLLHPNDRRRWNEFLALAHREQSTLDANLLKRWLMEEENWGEEKAYELSTEYERARALLGVYESSMAG